MKRCFLFAGQGAQYPGMGKDLWESSSKVKELFALASDATGIDCQRLLFEAGEDELKVTTNTQVAVTLVNVAAATVLSERGVTAEATAGFSLGEYSALHQAGVIRLQDLFPIVRARGQFMEEASRGADTAAGPSGMAAVLGLDPDRAAEVVAPLASEGVYAANFSSPKQVVLGGTAEGIDAAEAAFKEAGARRVVRLKVSGPFHTPLIEEASTRLAETLSGYEFSEPRMPVYANVTGDRVESGQAARELCVRQVVSPVRWVDLVGALRRDGSDTFYEVGPGSVLSGLWRGFGVEEPCTPVGTVEQIDAVVNG